MRKTLAVAFGISLLGISFAHAEEPVGCDKFKWPIDDARAALTAPNISQMLSGGDLASPPSAAIISLHPLTEAELPKKPDRPQKPEKFAGFVKIGSVNAGPYTVSLSDQAWVDAIQNGTYVKPKEFSDATGCEGIRKTIKFELSAAPLIIQISGASKKTIRLALQPVSP